MPVDDGVVPTASNPAMPIDVLIACLSPPPEPVPEPHADAASEVIRGMPETAMTPSSDASPGSVLSDSQWQALRQDAVDLLGQFYGSAAEKKVMEAAARYSPRENPILFLLSLIHISMCIRDRSSSCRRCMVVAPRKVRRVWEAARRLPSPSA